LGSLSCFQAFCLLVTLLGGMPAAQRFTMSLIAAVSY
jgi:hypothetical protein